MNLTEAVEALQRIRAQHAKVVDATHAPTCPQCVIHGAKVQALDVALAVVGLVE